MVSYGQSQREENAYNIPWRTFTQSTSGISPPVPPRGLERRAMTVTTRERHPESPVGGRRGQEVIVDEDHSFVYTSVHTFTPFPSLSLFAPPPPLLSVLPSLSLPPLPHLSLPLSLVVHFISSPPHSPNLFSSLSSSSLLLPFPTHPSPASLLLLQRIHPGLRHLSASDATTSYSSPVDSGSSDDLRSHVLDHRPKDNDVGVPLGTSVTVFLDVRTVNINKLFEVSIIWKWLLTLTCEIAESTLYS